MSDIRGRGGKETPTHSLIATKIQDKVTFVILITIVTMIIDALSVRIIRWLEAFTLETLGLPTPHTRWHQYTRQSIATTSVDSNKQVGSKSVK